MTNPTNAVRGPAAEAPAIQTAPDEMLIDAERWIRGTRHDARVAELLAANNAEVERRRAAENERDALAAQVEEAAKALFRGAVARAELQARAERAEAAHKSRTDRLLTFCDELEACFFEPLSENEKLMLAGINRLRAALAPVEDKGGADGR